MATIDTKDPVERGARANLWQSATLGLMDSLHSFVEADPPPDVQEITDALWCACHGGQQATAEYLLQHGGGINWIGFDGLTPLDAARRSDFHDLAGWLVGQGGRSAKELAR
jgi:hypothetical protein